MNIPRYRPGTSTTDFSRAMKYVTLSGVLFSHVFFSKSSATNLHFGQRFFETGLLDIIENAQIDPKTILELTQKQFKKCECT